MEGGKITMKIKAKNPKSTLDLAYVESYIITACLDKDMTFDAIRESLKKNIKQLPDGHVHQAALNAGFEVSG
jgi:hypothetical protein